MNPKQSQPVAPPAPSAAELDAVDAELGALAQLPEAPPGPLVPPERFPSSEPEPKPEAPQFEVGQDMGAQLMANPQLAADVLGLPLASQLLQPEAPAPEIEDRLRELESRLAHAQKTLTEAAALEQQAAEDMPRLRQLRWMAGVNVRLAAGMALKNLDRLDDPRFLAAGVSAYLEGEVVVICSLQGFPENAGNEMRVHLSRFEYVSVW